MQATQEKLTKHSPLEVAIDMVKKLHAGDPNLVREGAKHHGVQVTEGNLLTPIEHHAYNFRSPQGTKEEIQAIQEATTIVAGCMDYRQSDAIAEQYTDEPTALFFFTAGGAAQPDEARFQADVEFLIQASNVSGADLDLYFHTGVCGGANYYTHGEMKTIHDGENGIAAEQEHMDQYGIQFAHALVERGIDADKIHLHRVAINEQNAVAEIEDVSFA